MTSIYDLIKTIDPIYPEAQNPFILRIDTIIVQVIDLFI